MRSVRLLPVVLAILCLGLLGTAAVSSENRQQPADDPMMQAWMDYMKVGPEHQQLKKHFEGNWDCEIKWLMGGEALSRGTSEMKMALGGRFLEQRFDGIMHGQPMQGMGMTGYDNARKKYIGTWMDSMGTGMLVTEGTYDEATKTYELSGDMTSPDGGTVAVREVVRIIDDNKHTFELHMPGPDGNEALMMTITYTRKK